MYGGIGYAQASYAGIMVPITVVIVAANFLDDIADYLHSQGLGTVGIDIFVGKYTPAPDKQIAVLSSKEMPTEASFYIADFQFPNFQIMVRDKDYAAAATAVKAIRDALDAQIGLSLEHFYALRIHVTSSGYISEDMQGRPEFSMNFDSEVRAL